MFDPNAPLPDFQNQQADIDLQTKYADALRKRIMGMPDLRMVGNIAVKPSWAEYLAPVLQQYQAGQADKRIAASTQNMLNQQNQAANQWRSSMPQATPAVPGYGANEMDNEAVPGRPSIAVITKALQKPAAVATISPPTGMGIPDCPKVRQFPALGRFFCGQSGSSGTPTALLAATGSTRGTHIG